MGLNVFARKSFEFF